MHSRKYSPYNIGNLHRNRFLSRLLHNRKTSSSINRWMQQPAPSQYATVQEAAMYNFDKDYEDDRELLREDPYAEYPDFPKECRMTDMAQMDMVYC